MFQMQEGRWRCMVPRQGIGRVLIRDQIVRMAARLCRYDFHEVVPFGWVSCMVCGLFHKVADFLYERETRGHDHLMQYLMMNCILSWKGKNSTESITESAVNFQIWMRSKEKYCVTVTFTDINNCSEIRRESRPIHRKYTTKYWGAKGHKMCTCVFSHCSRVWIFVTPWAVAHQAPLSMGFSRQACCSGLPCPPPGDLPNSGIVPTSLAFPALGSSFFTPSTTWEAQQCM